MRFERTYASPQEEVWRALTQPDVLSTWYDQMIDYSSSRLDFADGANLLFVAKDAHLFPAQHGRVTRIDPPHRLEYTRASDVVRWRSAAAGNGASRLVLTVVKETKAGVIAELPQLREALDRLGTTLTGRTSGLFAPPHPHPPQ
jgi:uncharacterized protein YndB with AHSA1/START domain